MKAIDIKTDVDATLWLSDIGGFFTPPQNNCVPNVSIPRLNVNFVPNGDTATEMIQDAAMLYEYTVEQHNPTREHEKTKYVSSSYGYDEPKEEKALWQNEWYKLHWGDKK